MNHYRQEPKVGDLVLFDISWADTEEILFAGCKRMQCGIVTMVQKRARRAWDQYMIEWNGQDLLFFGNLDKIEVIGDCN